MEAFGFSSAFIKTNTRVHLMKANVPEAVAGRIHRDAICKVKLEVDIDPHRKISFRPGPWPEKTENSLSRFSQPFITAGVVRKSRRPV